MKIAKRCVCCDCADLRGSPAVLMPFLAHRIFGWETTEITEAWNMRDLAPGRAYSLCSTLECQRCGLVFLDMRFDDEEMAALYRGYRGPDYCAMRERFEPGYGARNAGYEEERSYIPLIEEILVPYVGARPRVLDWGGDTGLNTPFRSRAALHHIYEISDKVAAAGGERVAPDQLQAGAYDLIVSAHVVEHVAHPGDLLREMAAAMSAETILYLEYPLEELMRSPVEDRGGAKRHWHEHINFFSEAALEAMAARAGLAVLERQSYQFSIGGRATWIVTAIAKLRP